MALAQANEQPGNFGQKALGWPAKVRSYIEDLQTEMKRVSWPNWKQVRATTTVVIFCVFAFAAYFWVVDLIVGRGVTRLFNAFTR